MALIKYYTDENVAKAVVKGLRTRGVDVLTCQESNMLSASDEEQLEHATQAGRVIFSHDTDFLRIHATGVEHAGVVYTANRDDVGKNIRYLKLIHDVIDSEDMRNHVEFI